MLELYQLRQLAAFAEYGTLSEAAEKLFLSQPALSRNMRKLEEDIGVPLFVRSRNKLELNENGRLTAELAVKALAEVDGIVHQVQEYDRSSRTISLGVCAPAPVWKLSPLLSQFYPNMSIVTETQAEDHLINGLSNGKYHLVVLRSIPKDGDYRFIECGIETLMFSLPTTHKFADRSSLTFADMDGENFLRMSDVGFWHELTVRKMPNSRFLMQNDRYSFAELLNTSVLPSFTTNLAKDYMGIYSDRIDIPIADDEATAAYYLVCLKKQAAQFDVLFQYLQ